MQTPTLPYLLQREKILAEQIKALDRQKCLRPDDPAIKAMRNSLSARLHEIKSIIYKIKNT